MESGSEVRKAGRCVLGIINPAVNNETTVRHMKGTCSKYFIHLVVIHAYAGLHLVGTCSCVVQALAYATEECG